MRSPRRCGSVIRLPIRSFRIAAALADPERDRGCFIDVSMLESVIATMGWVVSNYLIAGQTPVPMGNENFTASPSGTFRTGDGLLNIAANKQEQFEAVCRIVGEPGLAADPRFADRHARLQHRAELKRRLEAALQARSAHEWTGLLNDAGVPAGPVHTVPQALAQPQIRARELVATFGDAPGVGPGFRIDGERPRVDSPPPALGEHTDAILTELGYDAAQIDALKAHHAV
jgi:crotonobetainyl-CoA:carnitine CoA-transferase CaiB-like acyl-CoA transferase